jgi:ribosome-associated toxin RatA of RatAB toxin-antitoxin module
MISEKNIPDAVSMRKQLDFEKIFEIYEKMIYSFHDQCTNSMIIAFFW